MVDAGATWLQQFPDNQLASLARDEYKLTLIPSDFNNTLCAAVDGMYASNLD